MIRRLLLFDVDGTLVRTGEVGASVFDAALQAVVGRPPAARIRMSGKTDPQIVAEYLAQMGIDGGPDLVAAVLDVAAQELAAAAARGDVAAGVTVLPGVETLLAVLAGDPGVASTLVTGNIAPNAVIKVGAYGLERWLDLSIGAYGRRRGQPQPARAHRPRPAARPAGRLDRTARTPGSSATPRGTSSAHGRPVSAACSWRRANTTSRRSGHSAPTPCSAT